MMKRALALFALLAPATVAAACATFGAQTDDDPAVTADGAPVEGALLEGAYSDVTPDASKAEAAVTRGCSSDAMCDSHKCVDDMCEPLVFVSSTLVDGNFGGLGGADQVCTNAARAASLNGTYRAFVGLIGRSPVTDATFVRSRRPYWRSDGKLVADSFDALTKVNLKTAIACDEKKSCLTGVYVWSATTRNGNPVALIADCTEWTNDGAAFGGIGKSDVVNESWAADMQDNCSARHPLYCFEQLE